MIILKGIATWATIALVAIYVMAIDSLTLEWVLIMPVILFLLSYGISKWISYEEMYKISGMKILDKILNK